MCGHYLFYYRNNVILVNVLYEQNSQFLSVKAGGT